LAESFGLDITEVIMSKKHFIALAVELRDSRPFEEDDEDERIVWIRRMQWNHDVKGVARACRVSHVNFDYDKFIKACGGLYSV
jgi:hypothetical protein